MHLFRSEEHARRWSGFDSAFEQSLRPVAQWHSLYRNDEFMPEFFRRKAEPNYMSWLAEHQDQAAAMMGRLAGLVGQTPP